MSERQPWWKSFLGIRKTPGQMDVTLEPDFDPFKPKGVKDAKMAPGSKHGGPKASSQTQPGNKESGRDSDDETYDDSHMDSVFNEQTCRRNMRVSRSGRFKEKRRVRSTLPIEEQQQQQDKNGARK
ncbi:proline-rich protein 15-like protein [Gadus chalcogrammus]|uniref:proline-rich protein 15-like protein n=1 Tax=Gadus chalcogrammus TaxID=1042646 RepID=UPI0024C4AFDB|nr:proline-rich protein 15-like protein [Gadus chalcogrammus]